MKTIVAIFVLLAAFKSYAGIFIEPQVGVRSGTSVFKDVSGNSTTLSSSLMNFGARAGLRFSGPFWIGLDARLASGTVSGSGGSLASDYSALEQEIYVDGGYDFYEGYRVYAGTSLFNSQKWTGSSKDVKLTDGNILHFGVGSRLRNFSFHLEYQTHIFSKIDSGSSSGEVSALYPSTSDSQLMVNIAFALGGIK